MEKESKSIASLYLRNLLLFVGPHDLFYFQRDVTNCLTNQKLCSSTSSFHLFYFHHRRSKRLSVNKTQNNKNNFWMMIVFTVQLPNE